MSHIKNSIRTGIEYSQLVFRDRIMFVGDIVVFSVILLF